MSTRWTIAVGVVAWLVVVAVGAGVVWEVISRAGEGVASPAQPDLGDGRVTEPRTRGPDPSPSPTRGSDSQQPPQAQQPQVERRVWQGDAGYVTAECDGTTITSRGAQPNPGWRIELDSTGPAEVEVDFETADERTRVRVEAACRDGVPVFEADTRSKG